MKPFINEKEKCHMYKNPFGRYECTAMERGHICPGKSCSSYKTTEQVTAQKEACRERIKSLPKETQEYIVGKYGKYQ